MKGILKEEMQGLDDPIELPEKAAKLWKKGKLKVIIHYEDKSLTEHFIKLKNDYYITIKKRNYMVLESCIIRGKHPEIHYYFNNPWPIDFKHQASPLKASEHWSDDFLQRLGPGYKETLAQVKVDSSTQQAAINSDFLKSMYARQGITTKQLLIIAGVIIFIILVLLQVTGVVDVMGWLTGSGG